MCGHKVGGRKEWGPLLPDLREGKLKKKKKPCRKLASCELDQMSEVKLTTGEPEAC